MFYESELQFLQDTLKKCRIAAFIISNEEKFEKDSEDNFKALFDEVKFFVLSAGANLQNAEDRTIYKLTTSFKLCYIFMLLPERSKNNVFVVGPFLPKALESRKVFEIGEKNSVAPHNQKLLESYFASIPVLSDSSHVFAMLDTFAECLWGSQSYAFVDLSSNAISSYRKDNSTLNDEENNVLLSMEIMEKRYAFENELMRAVSQGHDHKISGFFSDISSLNFERRFTDPLRDYKNYCIIMNTLLRKAAESGGVHPLYLDEISSFFATRIEQLSSNSAVQELMTEMYRSYCRLVRKHSMKNYSTPVRRAIATIHADLSGKLSLHVLAEKQGLSAGYLSTVFKKETGKTVTDYILGERMQLAMHLLSTTKLQIQTVALHCGVVDVQYFSKLFKKYAGKTPKEYRESVK